MMNQPMNIPPIFGDMIKSTIEKNVEEEVEIILIAFRKTQDGENLLEPTFVTSLSPEDMMNSLRHIIDFADENGDPETVTSENFDVQ